VGRSLSVQVVVARQYLLNDFRFDSDPVYGNKPAGRRAEPVRPKVKRCGSKPVGMAGPTFRVGA